MLAAASAILISLLATAAYYVITVLVSIGAQKYFRYDKPGGFLYKVIDFPLLLPKVLFEKMVHPKAVPYFYDRKDGYMRRQVVYFVLNVILYALPIYFFLMLD